MPSSTLQSCKRVLRTRLPWLFFIFCLVRMRPKSIHDFREVWRFASRGVVALNAGNYQLYSNLFGRLLVGERFHVVDVGANDGWFARVVCRFAPQASISSYEPLRSMRGTLDAMATAFTRMRVFPVALGSVRGQLTIKEAAYSGLSSLRDFGDNASYQERFSTTILDEYLVEVSTLDEQYSRDSVWQNARHTLLKIDTQGFELEVLEGARGLLDADRIDVILIELSTVESYRGQALYDQIVAYLSKYHFRLFDIYPFCRSSATGQLTEMDAVFVREEYLRSVTSSSRQPAEPAGVALCASDAGALPAT